MVCKKGSIRGFLATSWVLITCNTCPPVIVRGYIFYRYIVTWLHAWLIAWLLRNRVGVHRHMFIS